MTAPRHARSVEEILSRAQDALEQARSKRHGSFVAYKPNVELDAIRRERKLAFSIEIDGGITKENVADVVRAGCDWIVTGSSIFHTPDPAAAFAELRQAALHARDARC